MKDFTGMKITGREPQPIFTTILKDFNLNELSIR